MYSCQAPEPADRIVTEFELWNRKSLSSIMSKVPGTGLDTHPLVRTARQHLELHDRVSSCIHACVVDRHALERSDELLAGNMHTNVALFLSWPTSSICCMHRSSLPGCFYCEPARKTSIVDVYSLWAYKILDSAWLARLGFLQDSG